MQCPYCDTDVENYEEFNLHVLKTHPEKTSLEDFKEAKKDRLWGTSAQLTAICFPTNRNNHKEDVIDAFKFFLKSLMESGL